MSEDDPTMVGACGEGWRLLHEHELVDRLRVYVGGRVALLDQMRAQRSAPVNEAFWAIVEGKGV